jgi:hypothetical protein
MIKRRRTVAFAILLAVLWVPITASAETLPPEEVSVTTSAETLPPEEGRYTGPCMGEEAFSRTWLDRTHSYLTSMLCQPSVWFDGYFGQHRAGEDLAGSLVSWEGSVRLDERENVAYRSEFNASVRLPKMSKKVKLVITSETRDDQTNSHPDNDPYDLGPPPGLSSNEGNKTTAGLRFYLTDTRKVRLNVGAGLKLSNPVQPYVRFRLRYTEPLSSSTLLRLTPTVIWLKEDGINRSIRLDLEHRIGENVLVRASQSFVREELEPGILWGTVLTLYDRISTNTVLAFEAGATGKTHPNNHVERYRLATRIRSNFFRDWLFLELEPEYYWPLDELDEYHLFRAITFRLEMQFYS